MKNFFNMIYRLKIVKRWGTSANIYNESVAEHCYFVAIIANLLAEIDKKINGTHIEMERLIIKALYHDTFETYTTHIISPIKHYNNDTRNAIKNLKEGYKDRLLRIITRKVR